MFRIRIDATGDYIVLPDGATLPVEINSTLFNDQDVLLGSKSYTGDAPLEDNQAKIKNAQLMLSDPSLRKIPVTALLGATPWKGSSFNFTMKNGARTIAYNLFFDASLIVNQLKTVYLNQLSDPNIDDQLHFDTLDEYKTYLLSTTTAAPGSVPMVFFPIKNDHLYKTIDPANYGDYPDIDFPSITPYVNAWQYDDDGNGSFIIDDTGVPQSQTQCPAFYLSYVLKRVIRFLGFEPLGSVFDDDEFNRLVIVSMIPVEVFAIIADYWLYMPAMLLSDFLKELRTQLGLNLDFSTIDKTCTVDTLPAIEKSEEIVDLSARQEDDYEETGANADAYIITQQPDDKDEAFSDEEKQNLPQLTIGNLATAIQTNQVDLISACTKMLTETGPATLDYANWRIPYMKQPIFPRTPLDQISELAYSDRSTFKLRLLSYRGMLPDDAGNLYPYASADNLDKDGNALTRTSLAMGSASTAYVAVRYMAQFLYNCKPFQQSFRLSIPQLLNIKANQRIKIRDFNQAPVYAIMSQLAADLGQKEEIQAKLTLYPIVKLANTAEVDPVIIPGPPAPPYDNGTVWVKFEQRNPTAYDILLPPPERTGHKCDLYAKFYADEAMTTPKDVTALDVRYRVTVVKDFDSGTAISHNVTIACTSSSHESELADQVLLDATQSGSTDSYTYELLGSKYYKIIT